MSLTIIGTEALTMPLKYTAPRFFVKEKWNDGWSEITDLCELKEMDFRTAAAGVPQCEFVTRYGLLKMPREDEITFHDPLDLRDYWLKVTVEENGEDEIAFMGIIYNDVRDIKGSTDRILGEQPWVANGPLKILMNKEVAISYWQDAGAQKTIGWVPAKNNRDKRKVFVGNRSAERSSADGEPYQYGGKDLWSNLEYLEYVVAMHVIDSEGPVWSISGATDAVAAIIDSTDFGRVENVAQIFEKIIPRKYGLDYYIAYSETGFEIVIFSLLADDSFFGGSSIAKNPNILRVERGNANNIANVRVVRTRENMYDKFRILAKRVVICATLRGQAALDSDNSLIPNWTQELEDEYKAGSPIDSVEDDVFRKRDKFKSVYQYFTAPTDWDYRGGLLSPAIDLDGLIAVDPADFQNSVRRTLSWIPLKRDFDYSTNPETDNSNPNTEPELQAPVAYIYDTNVNDEFTKKNVIRAEQYIECHLHGMSVQVPYHELGICVNASPNHTLALNSAFEEESPEASTTDADILYDYATLMATIAWESDQVLQLGYDVPGVLAVGDGSIKVIPVDDAELWLLAPDTVVGLDDQGVPLTSGSDYRILRDDGPRLEQIAAGEIARYLDERVRSEMTIKCHYAWAKYLGSIMQVAEIGQAEFPGAPITMIQWNAGKSPQMNIRTGYA